MSNNQYNREQEIELIRQYQQTQDPMVLQRLRRIFAGTISSAVMQSTSYGLDQRTLNQKAMVAFSRALKHYDPSKGAPTTAITNSIKWYINNENNRLKNTTRLLQGDTILQTQIHKAKTKLELEGKNEAEIDKQLLDEVSKLRVSKEKVDKSWIEKIQNSTRRELTGDRIMGESGVGENLTFMDVMNTQEETAEEMFNRQEMSRKFQKALSTLTEQEQGLIKDKNPALVGMPESGKKLSWNRIAINNNYSSRYLAEKAYEKSIEKIREEMERDE